MSSRASEYLVKNNKIQVQVPAQCAVYGRYEFAAAHGRCVVGISARVLLVVPGPVLMPVVLLAPLVCDSTNRAENTSLPICGCAGPSLV